MHVESVSAYPAASSRDLDGWLSEELAHRTPPEFRTRLRVIAAQQAARIAAWSAFASLGASLALAGLVLLAYGSPLTGPLVMILAGAAPAAACLLLARRAGDRIPPKGASTSTRGAGSAVHGLLAAGGILLLFTALSSPVWLREPLMLWVNAGMGALLVSTMVVPAAIVGRGAESMRRRARREGPLRASLERERLAFTPTAGTPAFGPL